MVVFPIVIRSFSVVYCFFSASRVMEGWPLARGECAFARVILLMVQKSC